MAGVGVLDDVLSADLVLQEWTSLESEYSQLEVSMSCPPNSQGEKGMQCGCRVPVVDCMPACI